jgi:hypothetical protein
MRLSRLRVVCELRCLYIELKLFAFRPLPAIGLAQARQAGLSGKQKILLRSAFSACRAIALATAGDSAVILKEGSCYE